MLGSDPKVFPIIAMLTLIAWTLGMRPLMDGSAYAQTADPTAVTITVDRVTPDGTSQLATGVTHTRFSLDWGGDPDAVTSAKALLVDAARYQNQHIMGWGADNPEPWPGVYNWSSLDSRIAMIRSMGAEPVITLCCAPDWMKGGQAGTTDWSRLEVAPLPAYYDDFAELARQVALRYPDVKHFQVWNEMKGLWDTALNNWDYVAYTSLYNQVYDALKSVSPDIKVGGVYMVIEGTGSNKGGWAAESPIRARQWDVINYWLQNKHGADFICLDRSVLDSHDTNSYTIAELLARTHSFADIAHQIRSSTNLPIWWSEYYVPGDSVEASVANASALYHMLRGGSSVALLWNPMEGEVNYPLFSDARQPGGGQPLPSYAPFQAFHQHFAPGTQLYHATSSSPDIEVLASATKTLLIHKRPTTTEVLVDGTPVSLAPYEVRVLDAATTPGATSTATPTSTPAVTAMPSSTATPTNAPTLTATPAGTATPGSTPTPTNAPALTATPSVAPTLPPTSTMLYLSDINWTFATNGWGPVERNQSNGENALSDGQPLTIDGNTYAKGLGTNAASEVRYALSGTCTLFSAEIGVDDEIGANGSVVFQVWGDGAKLYESGVMSGDMAPQSIHIPIAGVQTLRLIATNGGDGSAYDHADWANASITCGDAARPPMLGTTSYVSDLPWASATNGWGPAERDRGNGEAAAGDGGPLTLNGIRYVKGIGVHAMSDVRVSLNGACTLFSAEIGLDDEVGANGSVVFQVWGDGIKRYESDIIGGESMSRLVRVDLTGVQELRLVVISGDSTATYDHADWADAQVTCGSTLPAPSPTPPAQGEQLQPMFYIPIARR